MIETDNLTKRYGHFTAVRGITFAAEPGEILGFLGPNGAGKTTTMRILTGYMPPTEGRARVAGYDVFTDSLEVRRHVGYLPETVPLYPDMTVQGYVRYIAALRGVSRAAARTDDVLRQVGMHGRRESLIRNISKGMRQRVGLAQAIVHDPEVLILDEPTIGLDPLQTLEVRDMVRGLGKEHTVMFSTHILSEAEQVCDRVIILDHGQIVAMDTPEVLRERLQQGARLFVRIGGAPAADAHRLLEGLPGVQRVLAHGDAFTVEVRAGADVRARIAAAVVGTGWELLELRPAAVSLEDIFIELTTRQSGEMAAATQPARKERAGRRAHA